MHSTMGWCKHGYINQMVKFASHRFQGIAGRSNTERMNVVLSSFETTLYGINVTCDCFGHWILKFVICPSSWLRVVSLLKIPSLSRWSNHL